MERNALIQEVYDALCKKFLRNIPSDKQSTFQVAYIKFLHNEYDKFFDNMQDDNFNDVACFCVRKESLLRDDMSLNDKCAFLFPDEDYRKFECLCLEIAGMARKIKENKSFIPELSQKEYSEKLNSLFNCVSELFKYTAEKLLSDALLDLETIFNNSQISSFKNADYN